MVKSKKTTGLIMACTAALAWSTFGTFSTLLSGYGLSEGTISLISPLFLLVGFTIVAIISSGIGSMKIPRKALVFLFLDGGCSALYNYACVQAYANLPIGIVSTVIYCNLFALIFICRIVFKDPITRQKLLAVGMALIGVMMVVNVFGAGSEGSITAKGLIWAFLAMLAWARIDDQRKIGHGQRRRSQCRMRLRGIILSHHHRHRKLPCGGGAQSQRCFYQQWRHGTFADSRLRSHQHNDCLLLLHARFGSGGPHLCTDLLHFGSCSVMFAWSHSFWPGFSAHSNCRDYRCPGNRYLAANL